MIMPQDYSDSSMADAAQRLHAKEVVLFSMRNPRSLAAHEQPGGGLFNNVPLHWMLDWPMPFPLIVDHAAGARIVDLDGHSLVDFCLGDTAAMFGHSPPPIRDTLMRQASRGLSTMLPSIDANETGRLLVKRFGLPHWQVSTTASDANRFAIRMARAVTGRRKILVFDGCYHGAVDDTLVDLIESRTVPRRSLLGQVTDTSQTTVAIPFNDTAALQNALASGEIACVLAEPVMTNCSMILPQPGFHVVLRELTRKTGTLLLLDETHTVSTGLGGYTKVHGLDPDIIVVGKAIAGGVPAAVWGFTANVAQEFASARGRQPPGHSGIGTTLSGSALQLACLRAVLEEIMTETTYAHMNRVAEIVENGLNRVIHACHLPWHVARVGARLEIVLQRDPLRDAAQARLSARPPIEKALHLALLNRGFLLTPFHSMVLISSATTEDDARNFLDAFEDVAVKLVEAAKD